MKRLSRIAIPLLLLSSCTFLLDKFVNDKYDVINIGDKSTLKIMFSHNINGETHPCGCRQNPLGGLPQVAGAMHEASQKAEILYVDTGDTFYPSAKFPDSVARSLNHTAQTLYEGLIDLKLKYFVPGDQDFAGDMKFLSSINSKKEITFLISNMKDDAPLNHKKFAVYKKGPHEVYLMGVLDPKVLSEGKYSNYFVDPMIGIQETYKEVKKAGYKEDNPFHRLILLSHSGISSDEAYAREFPHFDWIIGAHTQSFTRFPVKEGKTRPVQVLSRNHYLGEINIDLTKDKNGDSFQILEMRDEQKDKLSPNPFIAFIDAHKEKLAIIQKIEQEELMVQNSQVPDDLPMATAGSCIECHTEQGNFWQKTSHAIAYGTLINANESKNLGCIQCHSYGYGKENGFQTQSGLIHINPEAYAKNDVDALIDEDKQNKQKVANDKKLVALKDKYWKEVGDIFKDVKSIRQLDNKKRGVIAASWRELDSKHQVTHNYANVQCMNCHDQHIDHPFTNNPAKTAEQKYAAMKNKCLSCHVSDQSIEWYKDGKEVNELVLVEKMKLVACPKLEE